MQHYLIFGMYIRLKSNMDRFIGMKIIKVLTMIISLKSNMDRFIVNILFLMIFRNMV